MALAGAGDGPSRSRRRGKKPEMFDLQQGEESVDALPFTGNAGARGGRGGGARIAVTKSSKEVVHHHPPKEMATDVGFPVRGGQTLLIAYFPWEASEADIEREFSKFCRVKRVHLVVDKSSRKPRCFGFVKFMTKVDAEEALKATTQGLVQLPDTRGHVWHLKAEWTKSGDMVVDDSETEQEVAKRKEERKYRAGQRAGAVPVAETASRGPPQAKSGKWPTVPLKGALHPGVPAPLPPLQTRYPTMPAPLGLQGHMPVVQHGQGPIGLLGAHAPPAPQPHGQQLFPGQQLPQAQALAQQVYQGHGQPMFSGLPAAPPIYSSAAGYPAAQQPYVQAGQHGYVPPGQQPYAGSQQGYPQGQQTYSAQPSNYTAQPHAFPPQPGQGYVSSPPNFQTQAYAGYGLGPQLPQQGLVQPTAAVPHPSQQGQFGYVQQQGPGHPHAGVVTYGSYPGHGNPASPVQPHVVIHPGEDGGQESAAVAIAGVPHVMVSPAGLQPYVQSPPAQSASPASAAGEQSTPPVQPGTGDAAAVMPGEADASTAASGPVPQAVAAPNDTQYLDMVWQLSEMSLHDKNNTVAMQQLPAPPPQLPPAPPAGSSGHVPVNQWQAHSLREAAAGAGAPTGRRDWEAAPLPAGHGGGTGPAAVWNSFDDAAAKGMVDGLVGREDGATRGPPASTPTSLMFPSSLAF
mmetsp:Transcript_78461/g.221842  ORF Transcript_78461/g.221842 Transcript_78461/m.221842 type:complete len:684 (+) Transcript_78461:188-2239(+)